MSFAIYYILKNPDVLRKLQTEIYTVVGDQPIQCEDLDHLHYLTGKCYEYPSFLRINGRIQTVRGLHLLPNTAQR